MADASGLVVERVETVILDVPLRRTHRFARVSADRLPVLLVLVHTEGGAIGVGEGVVPGGPWWGGESVETMQVMVDRYVAPVVVGRRVDRLESFWRAVEDRVAANLFAKTAVDVALHDAWARSLGVPVHALLGGVARTEVDVTWAVGAEPVEVVVEEIEGKLANGEHRAFKLKMGALDPAADTARVCAIAERFAGAAGLRVDLNGRWDLLTSRTHLPRLAAAGIELIEQPVRGEQVDAMVELRSLLPVPLMADESLRTPFDALRLLRPRAADVWSVKLTKVGGFRRGRDVVAIAAAGGVACHSGTSLETSLGTAASLQLACAAPGMSWGSELFGPLLFAEEIIREPLRFEVGQLHLPEGPGLGVELDMDAVAALRRPGR